MFRGGVFRIDGPGDIRRGSFQDQKAPKGVVGRGGDARQESQNRQRLAKAVRKAPERLGSSDAMLCRHVAWEIGSTSIVVGNNDQLA